MFVLKADPGGSSVWLLGRRALPTRGSRLLPILVLGSCPGRQQSAQPPPRGQRGSHPHAPRLALLGVDASPPLPVRRCLLPRPQGLRALDSAWPGRASERAQCGSAGPGVAALGPEAARGLTAFVFFAQASRASRRAASPTTARPGRTITENRVSAAPSRQAGPGRSSEPADSRSTAPVAILSSMCACVPRSQCSPLSPSAPLCQTQSSLGLWASPPTPPPNPRCLPLRTPEGQELPLQGEGHWGPLPGPRLESCGQDADPPVSCSPSFHCPALFGRFRAGEGERDGGTQGTAPSWSGCSGVFLSKLVFLTVPETESVFLKRGVKRLTTGNVQVIV